MPSKYLHIISFNIPYPADYGGVIDIYYKIKALSEARVRVILHCFEYGRSHSKELEDLCFKVYYYRRRQGVKYLLRSDPYIVCTRNSNIMPDHLFKDSFPVFFEGLHTTGILTACVLAGKQVLVRAHNIEHRYYMGLARSSKNLFHRLFFLSEANKLKRYEKVLHHADHILSIARHETGYFDEKYGNALYIPPFHRFEQVRSRPGSGTCILCHGNLGVVENSEMILELVRRHLDKIPYQVVVAGKNPSARFRKRLSRFRNIRLVADPGETELDSLIARAHINLLFTRQSTGIKLKLLHALYAGRHCVVNPEMVEGSGLEKLCTVVNQDQHLQSRLHELMLQPFNEEQVRIREKALQKFSNRAGAEKILRLLA